MASHLLAHIGERVGKCFECEKLFGQSRDLKKHRATHSRKKNFTCIQCQRSFGEARALKNHIFKPNCWKLQNDSKIVSLKIGGRVPQKLGSSFSFFLIRKTLSSGQTRFLRPYIPLIRGMFLFRSGLRFSFRHPKCHFLWSKKRAI